MNLPDIRQLVPHSGQMVLLDRALLVDADCLVAEVRIHEGSMLGGPDGVGAWVGIEYMAQAISAHAGWHALQRVPAGVRFRRTPAGTRCNAAKR